MKATARFVLACAACTALASFGAQVRASDFPQEQKGQTPQNQKDQTLKDKEKKNLSSQGKKGQTPPEQEGKKPQNQKDQTPKVPKAQTPQDPNGQPPPAQKDQTWEYVKVIGVAEAHDSLDIAVALFNDCDLTRDQGPSKSCQQLHLVVKDAVVKDRIKELQRGDRITVTFTPGDANQNQLKQFCIDKAPPVPPFTRVWVLLACGFACFIGCYFCSRFHPLNLILGEDGRYSNSKFQIATWFFVLISTYLATVILRVWYGKCDFIGGVNIPQNLLLLSGMSAITFAGAKGITASKAQNASQTPGATQKTKAAAPSFWDLLQDDNNRFDFGDFQMLIITLLATGMYLVLVFNFLGPLDLRTTVDLPNVDTTILATFGLGQGAYLAKKAAGNLGQ